ncbi:MAG: signal recognition particle-docking protein FtsY [Ruminococcaceae bacterium]|nr:signal recognition particle-docking protein FtsY [Oscillospiraceae bacterium]
MFKSFFKKKVETQPTQQQDAGVASAEAKPDTSSRLTEGASLESLVEEELNQNIETEAPIDNDTIPNHEAKDGFFNRLKAGLHKTRSAMADKIDAVLLSLGKVDEALYEELEEALIMSDIGTETSAYIIDVLKARAKEQGIGEASALRTLIREVITEILSAQDTVVSLNGKPAVIMVIGVNGVGKTTSIGKLAHYYKSQGKRVILAAGDTFRAAAIDQLAIWAERAGVDLVKHQEGSDPSAVVYDSIQAAKARGADVVICDTAGRLHNKKNLMDELKKTARVVEREIDNSSFETLLVLDASTGQNALNQAREFAQAAGITGVILTKLDGTAKGGVILALAREQGIGVKFIGVGEGIDDLRPFNPEEFASALFSDEI